ncbi:MAG: pseudoazurin [Rhodocyclales bacterium]|nr:pseudoazurin [Rhodocyclales bacterium]
MQHTQSASVSPIDRPLIVLGALCLLLGGASAHAADHAVKMLNTGKDGSMVFEPAFVKVAVGDTVVFTPADKGAHNSASLLVPDGATAWKGGPDKEVRVKIEKEGVYLYVCEPHKVMGMVGVIQAGKSVNLPDAKAVAAKAQAAFALGKDRFDKALAQVD